jgi:hypothetical protein
MILIRRVHCELCNGSVGLKVLSDKRYLLQGKKKQGVRNAIDLIIFKAKPHMDSPINAFIWREFGAAIDMLENAIVACPDHLWQDEPKFLQIAHHTLFFLAYYLSDDTPMESEYTPPPPFTKSEFDDVPTVVWYTKSELLAYVRHGRQRLRDQLIRNTAEGLLAKRFVSEYFNFTLFELLLYNMRHVQHHTGQMNMLLRQLGKVPPDWVRGTMEAL